jgi:hypothetical protein
VGFSLTGEGIVTIEEGDSPDAVCDSVPVAEVERCVELDDGMAAEGVSFSGDMLVMGCAWTWLSVDDFGHDIPDMSGNISAAAQYSLSLIYRRLVCCGFPIRGMEQ